jgi:hypothetical protein
MSQIGRVKRPGPIPNLENRGGLGTHEPKNPPVRINDKAPNNQGFVAFCESVLYLSGAGSLSGNLPLPKNVKVRVEASHSLHPAQRLD